MTQEKKEKPEKVLCKPHHFVITGWMTKGGLQNATSMRCAQCLMPVCLEQLESKEWKESQGFEMSGLKGRIDKLYAGTISHVTSKITVSKDEKVIKQKRIGNNQQKVIEIVVRL